MTGKHPMQPLVVDKHGVIRFKANAIVRHLLDAGPFDMNGLALLGFSREDEEQFAQLIGYSVSGFGNLSYVSKRVVQEADKIANAMLDKEKAKKDRRRLRRQAMVGRLWLAMGE